MQVLKIVTKNITAAKNNAFFLLFLPGSEDLLYAKTIPNNADNDMP